MGRRGGATRRRARAAGVGAGVALVVAGVPTVSAGAATRDTTVLAVSLAGAGTRGAPVVVSAVRNDGELGAAQVTRVVDTRSINARGDAVLRADPAALAAFVDDTGVVNFELMTVADGTPRFASFSRQWTGVGWVDRDGVPVAAPVVLRTSQPAASPDRASGAMVHVKL